MHVTIDGGDVNGGEWLKCNQGGLEVLGVVVAWPEMDGSSRATARGGRPWMLNGAAVLGGYREQVRGSTSSHGIPGARPSVWWSRRSTEVSR